MFGTKTIQLDIEAILGLTLLDHHLRRLIHMEFQPETHLWTQFSTLREKMRWKLQASCSQSVAWLYAKPSWGLSRLDGGGPTFRWCITKDARLKTEE
jgi:hypothetical protein